MEDNKQNAGKRSSGQNFNLSDIAPSIKIDHSVVQASMRSLIESLQVEASSVLQNSIQSVMQDVMETVLAGFQQSVTLALQSLQQSINQSIQAIINDTIPKLDFGDLFSALPDLTKLIREWERLENELEQTGYGFTLHLNVWTLGSLRDSASINPKVRDAALTNKLLAVTRGQKFEDVMKQTFKESSVLKRRLLIIERAFSAHRERNYTMSIPVLLAQLEGVVTDILILKRMVAPKGKKLYIRNSDGKIKLDSKNKPVQIHGLGQIVQHANVKDQEVLNAVVTVLTNQLVGDRNAILHGRRISYGTAKLSTQVLLLISVIANEIAALEKGKIYFKESSV